MYRFFQVCLYSLLIVAHHRAQASNNVDDAISHPRNNENQEHPDQRVLQQRIVGGTVVAKWETYPFMVRLPAGCGGSLIGKNVVLTAAHCVEGKWAPDHVTLGDLNKKEGKDETTVKVAKVIIHDKYTNRPATNNDAAVLILDEPVDITKFPPIKYDKGQNDLSPGRTVTTIGWGSTSHNGGSSPDLREVEVKITDQSVCNKKMNGDITDQMLCASDTGKDACYGDSGGPLFDRKTNCLVGIVSWGIKCAMPDREGIYSRIESFHDWVTETVEKNGGMWCDDCVWDGKESGNGNGSGNGSGSGSGSGGGGGGVVPAEEGSGVDCKTCKSVLKDSINKKQCKKRCRERIRHGVNKRKSLSTCKTACNNFFKRKVKTAEKVCRKLGVC